MKASSFERRLYITVLAAVLTAIAIAAAFSQITGYSAYTGDELESHRSERVLDELREEQESIDSEALRDCLDEAETLVEEFDCKNLYEE